MQHMQPNPALKDLEALIGEWDVEVTMFPGQRGRMTVDWLDDGAALRLHTDVPAPGPSATLIVGRDDSSAGYTILYYDTRGVSRVYQMSFADGVWKQWRDAQGFWQRFSAALSDDGNAIQGAWESSKDGSTWEHDFDLTYTRVE